MTDTINVINYRDIDLDKLHYDHPKSVRGGGYISLAKYGDNGEPLFIQSPKLTTSSGICLTDLRCYIDLILDKGHWPFYEFLTNLDQHNVLTVGNNSNNWFNQTLPLDVIDDFYKTNIKLSSRNVAPKIRFKIPVSKGEIMCNLYNNKQDLINYTNVVKDSKVIVILELIGIKFLKQQYTIDWRVVQLQMDLNTQKINRYIVNDSYLSDTELDLDTEINNDLNFDKLDLNNPTITKLLNATKLDIETSYKQNLLENIETHDDQNIETNHYFSDVNTEDECISDYSSDVENFINEINDLEHIDEIELSKKSLDNLDSNELKNIIRETMNELNEFKKNNSDKDITTLEKIYNKYN